MIFIDRSIPRDVADALSCVRDDVEWLEPRFAHNTPDTEWLAEAGRYGWVVVTRDKRIRIKRAERQTIEDHRVGCFVLASAGNLGRWETLKVVVPTLDEMVRRFDETPRPFIFTIDSALSFRRYL